MYITRNGDVINLHERLRQNLVRGSKRSALPCLCVCWVKLALKQTKTPLLITHAKKTGKYSIHRQGKTGETDSGVTEQIKSASARLRLDAAQCSTFLFVKKKQTGPKKDKIVVQTCSSHP